MADQTGPENAKPSTMYGSRTNVSHIKMKTTGLARTCSQVSETALPTGSKTFPLATLGFIGSGYHVERESATPVTSNILCCSETCIPGRRTSIILAPFLTDIYSWI